MHVVETDVHAWVGVCMPVCARARAGADTQARSQLIPLLGLFQKRDTKM